MSGVLDWLVAPREGARSARPAEPALAATGAHVAVLVRSDDAAVAGGAVGLALARPAAVVAVWGAAGRRGRAPASPRARSTASRLAARGHAVSATGRLAVVTLAEPAEAGRVAAAAGDLPVVLVVAGPRDDATDGLVHGCDRAVVVGEGPIAELAAAGLDLPCRIVALPATPARGLAASGVALVGPLRAAVEAGLR